MADSKVIANIDFVEVLALQLVLRRRRRMIYEGIKKENPLPSKG